LNPFGACFTSSEIKRRISSDIDSIVLDCLIFPLTVSLPVLFTALISSIVTLIVVIYVILLLRHKNSNVKHMIGIETRSGTLFTSDFQTYSNIEFKDKFALATSSWKVDEMVKFLKSIFSESEYLTIKAMAEFMLEDGYIINLRMEKNLHSDSLDGWRNKHRIANRTGLQHSEIYSSDSVVDRLHSQGLIEEGEPDTSWGGQKCVYRLNLEHPVIRAYVYVLIKNSISK
jgi:hypothetical protein